MPYNDLKVDDLVVVNTKPKTWMIPKPQMKHQTLDLLLDELLK